MVKPRFSPNAMAVGVVLLAALAIGLYFSFNSSSISLTGHVLPSAPSNASSLDVYLVNFTNVRIDGQLMSFTALRFIAWGGGSFNITGHESYRSIQFLVVLLNRSNNSAPLIGKLLYQNGTGWNSTGTPAAVSTYVTFNYGVRYNTANHSTARLSTVNLQINGTSWTSPYAGSAYLSSTGTITVPDGGAAPSQHGNWDISFHYGRGGSYLGYYQRAITYDFFSGASGTNVLVSPGFVSPAGVNLTNLNTLELRLSERASALSNFTFSSCSDSDGGNDLLVGGVTSLIYSDGLRYSVVNDSCIPGSGSNPASTIEGACSGSVPTGGAGSCSSTACNSARTACAPGSNATNVSYSCFDSDGGNYSTVPGYVNITNSTGTSSVSSIYRDACDSSATYLFEYSCSASNAAISNRSAFSCPSGCVTNSTGSYCASTSATPPTLSYTYYCNSSDGGFRPDVAGNEIVTYDAKYSNGTYLFVNRTTQVAFDTCAVTANGTSAVNESACAFDGYSRYFIDSLVMTCAPGLTCSNATIAGGGSAGRCA